MFLQRFSVVFSTILSCAATAATFAEETPAPEFDPAHAEKMKAGLDLFKSNVRATLIKHCVDCHGAAEVQSGFDLATRKGLIRGGAKGAAVTAGKSSDSHLVRLIEH